MSKNYTITFKSLRAGTTYTVNIGGGTGTAVPLMGGAEPFVTEEVADEDPFTNIRTQSGYIRIVDNGKDANGNSWDWHDLIPQKDTSRPVTLTDGNGNTLWFGYMQAQNFGSQLYGNPQEREFPIQCPITILKSTQISTTDGALHNFAYLLRHLMVTNIPTHTISSYVIQGGADARAWLLKKLDWSNFFNETDEEDFSPKYNLYDVLEDVCRYWGWTARIHQTVFYLTCSDDSTEQALLTLTPAQLTALADETSTNVGTITNAMPTIAMSGDIFASTENDDFMDRGPSKATVKVDVNEQDTVAECFPPSVEKSLEANGYRWVQTPDEDMVGYFETNNTPGSFDSAVLSGQANGNYGVFSRRQIYSSSDSDKPTICDMCVCHYSGDSTGNTPLISLQTKKAMAFAGGSIILKGSVYLGSKIPEGGTSSNLIIRLGIGLSRATARWFYIQSNSGGSEISVHWSNPGVVYYCGAAVNGGDIVGGPSVYIFNKFKAFPVPNTADMYGFVYVDFIQFADTEVRNDFQIANFKIEFSRDTIDIPTSPDVVRARELVTERETTIEYTAENNSSTGIEWNADCIFATDNNLEYGWGLLMNADGTFLEKVQYGNTTDHPEQHLADRVADYWSTSKRRMSVELRTDAITEPTPKNKVTLDSTTFQTLAISHSWRDDITRLTLLQV